VTRSQAGQLNTSWLFRYSVVGGRERQMGLGSLAEVKLADARESCSMPAAAPRRSTCVGARNLSSIFGTMSVLSPLAGTIRPIRRRGMAYSVRVCSPRTP